MMSDDQEFSSSRRKFLKGSGAAVATGALATGKLVHAQAASPDPLITELQPWQQYLGDGVDARPYGVPSQYEAHVVRRNVPWLTADSVSSVNFTPLHEMEGIITPNGLCFERHHGGVADIDPGMHRLMINGLVDTPLVFTMEDIMRFPRENRTYFLECAANTGMEWRGCAAERLPVHARDDPQRRLYRRAAQASSGRSGRAHQRRLDPAEGADASAMTRSIPLEKALDDCLVATHMNGERLRPEQGYPIRLVVPGWEGNMWVKWLRRIEVGDQPWHHREETSKYTDLLEDGNARRFTWVMDAKSVITNPSPQAPITHGPGPTVITGVAWSGRGTIPRVDVTLDGGMNWHQARMSGPSLDKSMHRFYYEFDWDGSPLLLQSRAHDSTGYVQPTKEMLREVRGENSIYHNNGIQTWAIDENGQAENVEVG
jgi:sulfane dehydrogenase subunit SoxC